MTLTAQPRVGLVLLLALWCIAPAAAKRLKPAPELVPKPAKAELQVGSVRLHRCKDAAAYCGILSRPLDPADAIAGTIEVGFQFYPHTDLSAPPLETIVATEGGPGYSTTGTRHSYIKLFHPLMEQHDLLLMDDRGTGISRVVDCHLLQNEPNPRPEGIAACGAQMGKAAYLYGGALAAGGLWCWTAPFPWSDCHPGIRRLRRLSAMLSVWLVNGRAHVALCPVIRHTGLKH